MSAAHSEAVRTLIIVITAASTMNNAVEAMKRGAHDYLTKPFANLDLVAAAIKRAVEVGAQAADLNRLKDEVNRQLVGGEIIGRSAAMQEVYKLIGRVVTNDATVLLCGESGTGKELVARAIHFKSARWRSPFVAVNCSAIPHGLLESELFGHERGSFTGATERRAGKFEMADSGTIFLDEIGDLPLELQPKLLRVLQEREFNRVGGVETLKLKARVIAATNQDLETLVARAQISRGPVLPPARDSDPDAAAARAARRYRRADRLFRRARRRTRWARSVHHAQPRSARSKLEAYEWPGNVRELENAVMRAALLAPGTTIRADDIELRGTRRRGHRRGRRRTDGAALGDIISARIAGWFDSSERRRAARPLPSDGGGNRTAADRTRAQARGRQPGQGGADARAQSQHAAQENHRPQNRADQVSGAAVMHAR